LARLALNEAEALAWQTGVPHLVFPELADEKIRELAAWRERQMAVWGGRTPGSAGARWRAVGAGWGREQRPISLMTPRRRRAAVENRLAIPVGENSASFRFGSVDTGALILNPALPHVPAGLRADLLERQPDVAEAERQLAAAKGRICGAAAEREGAAEQGAGWGLDGGPDGDGLECGTWH
jgi:hypothetical protein